MRSSLAASGSPWVVPIETPHQPNGPAAHWGFVCRSSSRARHSATCCTARAAIALRASRPNRLRIASRSPLRIASSVRAARLGIRLAIAVLGRVEGDDADAQVR